jgi:hypothetical protein
MARRFGILWSAGPGSSSPGANHVFAGERWIPLEHRAKVERGALTVTRAIGVQPHVVRALRPGAIALDLSLPEHGRGRRLRLGCSRSITLAWRAENDRAGIEYRLIAPVDLQAACSFVRHRSRTYQLPPRLICAWLWTCT